MTFREDILISWRLFMYKPQRKFNIPNEIKFLGVKVAEMLVKFPVSLKYYEWQINIFTCVIFSTFE